MMCMYGFTGGSTRDNNRVSGSNVGEGCSGATQ